MFFRVQIIQTVMKQLKKHSLTMVNFETFYSVEVTSNFWFIF